MNFNHNHKFKVSGDVGVDVAGTIEFELGDNAVRLFEQFIPLVERFVVVFEQLLAPRCKIVGGDFMLILKADNPDLQYKITPPTVQDSEGNVIDNPALTYETSSTDPDVIAITPDAENPTTGSVHIGHPGLASVNVLVKSGEHLLGSFGEQFTITAGDPDKIAGGSIDFNAAAQPAPVATLPATPVPEAPAAPESAPTAELPVAPTEVASTEPSPEG